MKMTIMAVQMLILMKTTMKMTIMAVPMLILMEVKPRNILIMMVVIRIEVALVCRRVTSSGNCPAMVTYQYLQDSNQFQFKLHIKSVNSGRYVAVGFSNDPKMGDDLVIFCSTEDGASPQLSWNEGKSNKRGVQGLDLLQKISVTAVDGAKSCDFTLPNELKFTPPGGSEQKSYDIGSGKYHMLLSIGPFASSSGNLNYHDDKVVSAKPLNLK